MASERVALLRPVTLALAVTISCATATTFSALDGIQPGTAVPTGDRRCGAAVLPVSLPPVDSVLDSAAAAAAFAADSNAPDQALLSVAFLRTGHPRPVHSLPQLIPVPGLDHAERIVNAALRAQRPGSAWGVRILVKVGPPARLSVERSSYCEPGHYLGTVRVTHVTHTVMRGSDIANLQAELAAAEPCTVRFTLDTLGTSVEARIVKSSGSRFMDDLALDGAGSARYLPALLDGFPIDGWVEIESCRPNGKR